MTSSAERVVEHFKLLDTELNKSFKKWSQDPRLSPKLLNELQSASNEGFSKDQVHFIINFLDRRLSKKSKNVDKIIFPIFNQLIPSEALRGETLSTLILWSIRMNEDSSYFAVFKWISNILNYSLCPLTSVQVFYDILFRKLSYLSDKKGGQSLLHLLSMITLLSHVNIWRTNYLKRYSSNKLVLSLLAIYNSYLPKLSADIKMDKIIIPSGSYEDETSIGFAGFWKPLKRKFIAQSLSLDSNLILNHNPKKMKLTNFYSESKTSLLNCSSMKDLFFNVKFKLPDRSLSILDEPQLYILFIIHPQSKLLAERFSFTVSYALRDLFMIKQLDTSTEIIQKRISILKGILRLECFLQEAVPSVNHFLCEYVSCFWDGVTNFEHIIPLLGYFQITDFFELQDCLFSRLFHHCKTKYDFKERLLVLEAVKNLILFWIEVEYDRYVQQSKKQVFKRSVTVDLFPLMSIYDLIIYFGSLVEFCYNPRHLHHEIYLNQVLKSYETISSCLLDKKLPIRVDIPRSISSFYAISTSPHLIAGICKYVNYLHFKIIPMCRQVLNSLDKVGRSIAKTSVEKLEGLNYLIADILAILSGTSVQLTRGESMFRPKEWDIEHEEIRSKLGLIHNAAFIKISDAFSKRIANESGISQKEVIEEMSDPSSLEYEEYLKEIQKTYPSIGFFMNTFEKRNRRFSQRCSLSTSGFSSMCNQGTESKKKTIN